MFTFTKSKVLFTPNFHICSLSKILIVSDSSELDPMLWKGETDRHAKRESSCLDLGKQSQVGNYDGVIETPRPYLNSSAAALAHSVGDSSSGRVDHGDKTHKAEVIHREIDFVSVELEAFRELFIRQKEVAETCKGRQGTHEGSSAVGNEIHCSPSSLQRAPMGIPVL